MLQGKRTRRIIAATLLTVMLTETFAPTVAYALTSGPTAPEANSFEPVDTSDMVNLLTGDLTYNVPLLEVPGPEGGYPLALAYHAGIQPGMDASWVGLGWSLNPGAITRDVNGYPDDYSNIQMTRRDFWNGGSTTTYQFGVSVGLAGSPASVNFGLSVASDTYKGFGVGLDAGVGISYGPAGIGASVGINPYGGGYASAGVSIGTGVPVGSSMALGVTGSFSISTNFETVDAGVSASGGLTYSHAMDGYDKPLTHSILGVSIASNGIKPSLSVGGMTASSGSMNAGRIQTSSSGFGIGIPITPVLGVYLGRKKVRYWSDETLNIYTNGSLNMEFAPPDASQGGGSYSGFQNHAYDVYHLYDNEHYNMGANPDARVALGGSFPDNDYYNVTAQGVGGNIRPYAFQEELYIQNDKLENNKVIRQWMPPYGSASDPIHYENPQNIQYRFVNDFSNRHLQTQQNFVYPDNWVKPAFASSTVHGKNGNDGYNAANQQLPGSRHIEYIWNINMLPGTSHTNGGSKFYDPVAPGFVRKGIINGGTDLDHSFNYQIGGFKVTNESGATYHYMLPAYSGSEYVYSRQKGNDGNFNMQKKDGWYAYAWYLTGLTGPDYVDANNDGIINEGDWGYWVSFEYGKWASDYVWRNPEEGFHGDIDNSFESQSAGKKELYYLNKVKTATHSAIFEKAERYDGKSVSNVTTNSPYGNYPLYNGGWDVNSRPTMSLNRIMIMKNEDANALSTVGNNLPWLMGYHNVFETMDFPSTIAEKAIRSIEFNYDYSLCSNTPNSFNAANPSAKMGKLTLKSLLFKGKKGVSMVPPLQFNYEPDNAAQGAITTAGNKLNFSGTAVFKEGDIVRFSAGTTYYAVILKVNASDYDVKYIEATPGSGVSTTAVVTKNPPFNKDKYDMWNLYKSDYDAATMQTYGENNARTTSAISSKGTDVWSLHSITTAVGAKINIDYEGDQYNKAVLEQGYRLQMYDYPNSAFNFNSNTDNKFWYVIRNREVLDRSAFYIGARFDAILLWIRYGGSSACHELEYHAIDTKIKSDCYLEINDLSRFDNEGIIGFKFNNVFTYPHTINQFPGGGDCFRMPHIGNIKVASAFKQYGGNLRVKSVGIVNTTDNRVQRTVYDYNQPGASLPSGVTSYEPSIMDVAEFSKPGGTPIGTDQVRKEYKTLLYTYNSQVMSYTRELPPPGVMYEYVSIQNEVVAPGTTTSRLVEGKTTYQFEVFNENMVGVKQVQYSAPVSYPGTSSTYNTLETRTVALKNFTTRIGNVKRIVRYDDKGKKLSETNTKYLHDDIAGQSFESFDNSYQALLPGFNQQGVVQENFVNIREQRDANDNGWGQVKAVNAQREEYPAIMTGQTTIDYVNNTKVSSQNVAYDFYSGALTKKIDVDAYGNRFMSEIIPAYLRYPQMGMKFDNLSNKNMLTQEAARYLYKLDNTSNNVVGLVSASVQTWSNAVDVVNPSMGIIKQNGSTNGNVWRKHMSYNWMPEGKTIDGITPYPSSFTDFNWGNPAGSVASWTKTAEMTLFDTYSHALEATDINGNYAASKMGYNNAKVVITGGPARYNEITFTGAEDNLINGKFGGEVSPGGGTVITTAAHTGHKSLKVTQYQNAFTYTLNKTEAKPYLVSVWAKDLIDNREAGWVTISAPGWTDDNSSYTKFGANGWTMIQRIIPASVIGQVQLTCIGTAGDVAYDDFRVQPANATAAAYVYDNLSGELTYVLDNNNIYTRFEYDAVGRLVRTYREKLNVGEVKVNEYYHNYAAASTIFANTSVRKTFTRNDCGTNGLGGQVEYIVPDGKHISTLSQADANTLAQADINANGQDYANRVGTCTPIWKNAEKWQWFTKNNCPSGYRGATVQYLVPYGRYTSTINQADADAKAQADINANGQTFANTLFDGCYEIGHFYVSTNIENVTQWTTNASGITVPAVADVVAYFYLDPTRDHFDIPGPGQIIYFKENVLNRTTNTITTNYLQTTTTANGGYRYVLASQAKLEEIVNGNAISRQYSLEPTAFFWYTIIE
jgi:hypothetical protein